MEVVPVGSLKFKNEGVINDQKFYVTAQDILKDQGFSVMETAYIQFGGGNYHVEWVATKIIDDYMSYRINIVLEFTGLADATITKGGQQIKVRTGTISVEFNYSVLLDYLNKWTTGISKIVKPVYDKMNSEALNSRKAELEREVQDIKAKMQNNISVAV
ncbi:MAG: hypothetical protein RAK22_02955 [Nanoarchaeota archaeon]|nr:hypothetical protein [Nanoarchaeota archaeon]